MDHKVIHKSAKEKKIQHRKRIFTLGFVVILCFVTGVVLLSSSVIKYFAGRGQQQEPDATQGENAAINYDAAIDFDAFEKDTVITNGTLLNFAKHEFPPFLTADEIPMEYLVSFGVWEVLKSETYANSITYDDSGSMLVPATEVTKAIAQHFTLTKYIEHQAVDIHGSFAYDSQAKTYTVPVFGLYDILFPRIMACEKTETGYILDIDYILSTQQEEYEKGGAYPQSVRQARVALVEENGVYSFLSQTSVVKVETE